MRGTLARPAAIRGVALHCGAWVTARLMPAECGAGVRFVRTDLPGRPALPLTLDAVGAAALSTTLGAPGGPQVGTVEHLAAALLSFGIDDCEVALDGPELPLLDGAAAAWLGLLRAAGRAPLDAPRTRWALSAPVQVEGGGGLLLLRPAQGLLLDVSVNFGPAAGGPQRLRCRPLDGDFATELAWARTFGALSDLPALSAAGLARGAHLDAVVVFGPHGPLSGGPLPDRLCARHKALDLLGDLALLGGPLQAQVIAVRHGHALVHAALRAARDQGALHRVEV
ncbi:MAG: UDP-3-O-acyl-N-acetylglucosamine deacetylase [Deltaproteobacteria bacterium]|nr:UDP-3-O-acyl-N-acetylglucosamine deacetylase [Deltaproteobacteria bacterium]